MGLLQTTELFLVADEGALELSTDIKGASGLRPCLKCDVVSRARDGLPGLASVRKQIIQSLNLQLRTTCLKSCSSLKIYLGASK